MTSLRHAKFAALLNRLPPRKRQFSLRAMVLGFVLLSLLFTYTGSYYRLSRRGMAEAKQFDSIGFLYIPMAEAEATHDLTRHHVLSTLYAPLNYVDCAFFGGQDPILSILWEIE